MMSKFVYHLFDKMERGVISVCNKYEPKSKGTLVQSLAFNFVFRSVYVDVVAFVVNRNCVRECRAQKHDLLQVC